MFDELTEELDSMTGCDSELSIGSASHCGSPTGIHALLEHV